MTHGLSLSFPRASLSALAHSCRVFVSGAAGDEMHIIIIITLGVSRAGRHDIAYITPEQIFIKRDVLVTRFMILRFYLAEACQFSPNLVNMKNTCV